MAIKQIVFFVLGTESSGSTYVAKVLNNALNGPSDWNGRGWNDNNDPYSDQSNHYTQPSGHHDGILVCHRSIPFDGMIPPVDLWRTLWDCRFIWCHRDMNISEKSRLDKWGPDRDYVKETQQAGMIYSVLAESDEIMFDFSYEAMVSLKGDYLRRFFWWVNSYHDGPIGGRIKDWSIPDDIRDENAKYFKK